jgi:hypothetical protein
MNETIDRPDIVTDEMLDYLDALRESGVTNMYGARPYVEDQFGLGKSEAGLVLGYWMKSFGERHPR